MESSKNTRNNVADTLLPSSTSTIFKLQATKNIKLVKSHCIFYDLLIKREIKKIVQPTDIQTENKYNYYKDLFEEQYTNSNISIYNDIVDKFFSEESNSLISESEDIIEHFQKNSDTLFIIPTYFDEDEDMTNEKFFKKNQKIVKNPELYDKFVKHINSKPTNISNTYYFQCLIPSSKSKMNENDYVSKLKDSISNLQDYLKEDFLKKYDKHYIKIFKKINFFCEPDGSISLNFFNTQITQTNRDFLNKHLFKEILKLKGNIKEGVQTIVKQDKYIQPLVYKKTKSQIKKTTDVNDKF